MTDYPFSRELRLLTPSDFSQVFQEATAATSPSITILARKNELGHSRLGLAIAKKRVKKAVARNRIKRIARDSFRHHQQHLPSIDIVLMAKSGADLKTNEELHSTMEKLWKKIAQRCKK